MNPSDSTAPYQSSNPFVEIFSQASDPRLFKRITTDMTDLFSTQVVGKVYRSPAPLNEVTVESLKAGGIDTVVCLLEDRDLDRFLKPRGKDKEGFDLIDTYEKHGLGVIRFPIKDFRTPAMEELLDNVKECFQLLQEGHSILVHCMSGKGRTGLFLAALYAYSEVTLGNSVSGEDAIYAIRSKIRGAVETKHQKEMVSDFIKEIQASCSSVEEDDTCSDDDKDSLQRYQAEIAQKKAQIQSLIQSDDSEEKSSH